MPREVTTFRIRRGLDVVLAGAAGGAIETDATTSRFALLGRDAGGDRLAVAVAEGDRVRAGDPVLHHRRHPEIRHAAPVSGRIASINRGPRRRLESVVIEREREDHAEFPTFDAAALAGLAAADLCRLLLDAGLWPAFRGRPHDHIPAPDVRPRALLVTALDTEPLAPDPSLSIARHAEAFGFGLAALARLPEGPTYLCRGPGPALPIPAEVAEVAFHGGHPAGLVGTHIAALGLEVGDGPDLWHVGYQDVISIGRLLASGRASATRVVAVCGPGALRPRLVETTVGADLEQLLGGEVEDGCRIVSGSALNGHAPARFLGRYDRQVTVLKEGRDTALGGLPSGMLPVEAFERVWPFASPPSALLRALLVGDAETARALGALALAEEDLALCTYVCPAKRDYGVALRATLDAIRRGG